jgi:sugar lactone lactonase YvrE
MARRSAEVFAHQNQESSLSFRSTATQGAPESQNASSSDCRLPNAFAARNRRGRMAVALAALLLFTAGAWAQNGVFSTPQPVGVSSTAQSVTVTAQAAGAVTTVEVLTSGASGLDFTAGSGTGTCGTATLAVNQTCTQSVAFKPAAPGLRLGAVVLLGSGNRILGTAYLSGVGSGGLGVLVSGNILPVAGNGKYLDPVNDPGLAANAELYIPSSVTLDGIGNLYIADTLHNRIRMVCAGTTATIANVTCPGAGIIITIAGDNTVGYDGDGKLAANANLDQPSGVALDGAGNLYIADTGNNVVREIYAATGIINTVAGNGTAGFGGDTLLATSSQTMLFQPQNVALDAAGNLYISDTDNQRIRRVDAVTGIITTVAGNGTAGYAGDTLVATSSNVELNFPRAVAFDSQGNWYIADSQNNRIREVSASTGIITTVAGNGTPGYTGNGGAATAAEMEAPSGVAVDPAGNLYIADTQNNAIRKVSSSTGYISQLAKSGAGEYYSGGAFSITTVYGPLGLFLDSSANLYFADSLNMVIREIQSNFVALDFTKASVRQGSESATVDQTVENDGNATLSLTPPDIFVDTADPFGFPNAALDTTQTTCLQSNPFLAAADDSCVIGAVFAPSLSLNFNGAVSMPLTPVIDIGAAGDTVNSPLEIELVGVATALNSTTVKLTSSQNPSSYGQKVIFTAMVTTGTGTGTLTGTVTFYDGATILQAGLNLSGGATYVSISTLAVGTHSITAVYSGDSSHFSGTSAPLLQVVNEGTATTLASSANPSVLGASVTFTATVTTPNGGGIPLDGTVTFTDTTTATTLCAPALALVGTAYQATCIATALAYGPHTITATYSGDAANYITGSSATLPQDVQAPSTTLLTTSGSPSTFGNPVTFTVTVPTIGTVAATGSVSIFEAGVTAPLGTVTLAGNPATGTFAIFTLPVSTVAAPDVITASYPGDLYYAPSTSLPVDQIVNQAQTTTTLSAKPVPGIAGAPEAITTTVTLAGGTPMTSGTVTFTDTFNGATVTLGTQPLSNAGTATVSPLLAPGTHSIVATYSGTTNAATSSATYLLTVIQATTSTVVTATPSPALVDTAVTLTATVASIGGGTPTGTVTFSANGTQIGTPVTLNAGMATITDSTLAAASYTITAVYSGDPDDQASTGSASLVVGKIPTETSLGVSTTTGANPQVILVAAVLNNATGSPASLPTPTGIITFTSGTTTIGSAPLDSSGVATLTPDLPTGTYSIVAAYGGDSQHEFSSSAAVSVTNTGTGFNLIVTPPTVTVATGQYATVNVALTSINGFSDTIGLGCASLPAGVTCHFSSPTTTLQAGGVSNVTLTIDTNNPLGGGSSAMNTRPGSRGVFLAGLFLPLGVLFGFVFWRFRKRFPLATAMALLLLLGAGAGFVTGCSGFSQSSATPGTYVIQVTGVGANSDISHYQNVSLTISAK